MSDDATNGHHPRRRSEAFFGRRKTRALSERKLALADDLLPELSIDLSQSLNDLPSLFAAPVGEVQLEIGFGGGEHLLHRARTEPEVGFIGAEPFVNGMAKMLSLMGDDPPPNLRLYGEDAVELLDALPPSSLTRVDLLYPDPWPKRRHNKRRFVSDTNLARIARVLCENGEWRVASDIPSYVDWTLHHANRSGGFRWLAERPADWNEPWEGWIRTRYEAKAVREGRTPAYLRFARSR